MKRADVFWASSAGLILFALYLATGYPSVGPRDAGELAVQAFRLGIAHPPGYPLYALAGKGWLTILPWGNPAYRLNAGSAFCVGLAMAVLCATGLKLGAAFFEDSERPGRYRISCFLFTIALGASPAIWNQAVVSEVFAGHLLLSACLLHALVGRGGKGAPPFYLFFLLLGLGLGNQQTLVLFLPGALALSIAENPLETPRWKFYAGCAFFFLLGSAVYAYLPIRAAQNPPLNFGNIDSWNRWVRHVLRSDYGSLQLSADSSHFRLSDWREQIQTLFSASLPWAGLLAPAGAICLAGRSPKMAVFLLLGYLLSGPAFLALARMTPSPDTAQILERFFGQPLLFQALLTLAALAWSLSKWPNWFVPALLVILALSSLWENTALCDRRRVTLTRDWGADILRHLPSGSILTAGGDTTIASILYLQETEGVRPDVRLILPGTSDWYREILEKRWPEFSFQPLPVVEQLPALAKGKFPLFTTDSRLLSPLVPWGLILRYARDPSAPEQARALAPAFPKVIHGTRRRGIPYDPFLQEIFEHYPR